MMISTKRLLLWFIALIFIFYLTLSLLPRISYSYFFYDLPKDLENRRSRRILSNEESLIFIGGVPRSGTTLMRAMLDAHEDVRCGEETRVIPDLMGIVRTRWERNQAQLLRLAGVSKELLQSAVSAFLLEIIAGHGTGAKRFCNKDPLTMSSAVYISEMFPNAKFLLMLRDARATVHSMISRKVPVVGFDHENAENCFIAWNKMISEMHNQCIILGKQRCLMVHYEKLVMETEPEMERILKFLDLPWSSNVLHHEMFVGTEELKLSPFVNPLNFFNFFSKEFSTDQVVKPVNLGALGSWFGFFNDELLNKLPTIAPMLTVLGYNVNSSTPNYQELVQTSLEGHRESGAEQFESS